MGTIRLKLSFSDTIIYDCSALFKQNFGMKHAT